MSYVLGWKDILRPIRDGYRHLFPSPDTGPTPEERQRQQQLDRLKGFTYFDTFEQLDSWNEAESDPIQRANTPLLARASANEEDQKGKANILICHDYSGNYHDYEAASETGLEEEHYCCEYLQYVESFVYFSHKLVCVPPPSWSNSLHRNGVKSLGTLLIEPQTKDPERLLRSTTSSEGCAGVQFPLAMKLSQIARHYGFDGWLINIEKSFPQNTWTQKDLGTFLCQLKEFLGPSGELVWYDALTKSNNVAYQNGLNEKNVLFASSCGAVLTNYCWKETNTLSSREVALKHALPLNKVYFGIDVWAQNVTNAFTQPRTTYPEVHGGGTYTGIAVNKLAETGLSAGVFAPAWSFEHFPRCNRQVERSMWEGNSPWGQLPPPGQEVPVEKECLCLGGARECHPDNEDHPIIRSATRYAACSENFFYTDFSRAFAGHGEKEGQRVYGGHIMHSQLSSQAVLPTRSHVVTPKDVTFTSLASEGNSANLRIIGFRSHPEPESTSQKHERELPLFKLDMPTDGSLQLTISCTYFLDLPQVATSFYLKFNNGIRYLPVEISEGVQVIRCVISAGDPEMYEKVRLQELGVRIDSVAYPASVNDLPGNRILDIHEIRIVPRDLSSIVGLYSIHRVTIEKQGEGGTAHWRLRWAYQVNRDEDDKSGSNPSEIPHSNITGPFSYFTIQVDGVKLGRAYALEYVLSNSFVVELRQKDAMVVLVGMGFDGRQIARCELDNVPIPA